MNKTTKAAIVHELGKPLAIDEVPIPSPGPGEGLIQVIANGVCHPDIHAGDGDWSVKPKLPFIPSHEAVGLVSEAGPGVSSLKEEDPVGVVWLRDACGACEYCIIGWETLCESQDKTDYDVNSGFAEYVIALRGYVGKLPSQPNFAEIAPILCAGVTNKKANVKMMTIGENVMCHGCDGYRRSRRNRQRHRRGRRSEACLLEVR